MLIQIVIEALAVLAPLSSLNCCKRWRSSIRIRRSVHYAQLPWVFRSAATYTRQHACSVLCSMSAGWKGKQFFMGDGELTGWALSY